MEASSVTSTEDKAPSEDFASSSVKEQAAALSEHRPHSSEAAESRTAADDVMVQIRAGKSEVGLCQQICQLFCR